MSIDYQSFIDKAQSRHRELESAMAEFDFNDPRQDRDAYEKISREYQRLGNLLQIWSELVSVQQQLADNQEMLQQEDDDEFLEVIRNDVAGLEKQAERLELKLKAQILPPDPNENRNIIMEIRPAAGGEESALFSADMFRMYSRMAEEKGWRLEVLNSTDSDLGGLREISFSLAGEDVYRLLRYESGVHRVQRVPTTEASGRIHTSTVTVTVLPEAEEVDVEIRPEDLRIDVFRSSGPGGQHVNTTDSAVRVTHLPTGLAVASQREKSQHRNKELAMRILRAQLYERLQEEEAARQSKNRKSQMGSGMRSERIRTYNFPQNRVSDHRYELTVYDLANIIEGDLEPLLEQIISIDVDRRMQEEMQV